MSQPVRRRSERGAIKVLAPAKLNLGLRILARRADGYHEIETLFVPLALYDRLRIESRSEAGVALESSHPGLPVGPENLAVRAAKDVCRALGRKPALHIQLDKHIPVAAGLGGGSSDAAAVILGLEALFGERLAPARRAELALGIGADVPFFLSPRPCVGRGVGEILEPVPGLPEMWWLLVSFPFGVSTRDAYLEASRELTLPRRESSIAALLGPSGALSSPYNDLESVTARRHPEIEAARRVLEAAGASVSGMSGSGPTVYGRFNDRDEAERAAREARLPVESRAIVACSPASEPADWGWGVAKR